LWTNIPGVIKKANKIHFFNKFLKDSLLQCLTCGSLKILLVDKDLKTALAYKTVLEERKHHVVMSNDIEDCLQTYHNELDKIHTQTDLVEHMQPFDAVILEYKISGMNGIEAAKEILTVNPRQRVIIATDCITHDLLDSVKNLASASIELLQKPSGDNVIVSLIEEKEILSELQKLDVNVDIVKSAQFRHEQMRDMLDTLRKRRVDQNVDLENSTS
jgi:CheY-like chemotaxis protein